MTSSQLPWKAFRWATSTTTSYGSRACTILCETVEFIRDQSSMMRWPAVILERLLLVNTRLDFVVRRKYPRNWKTGISECSLSFMLFIKVLLLQLCLCLRFSLIYGISLCVIFSKWRLQKLSHGRIYLCFCVLVSLNFADLFICTDFLTVELFIMIS